MNTKIIKAIVIVLMASLALAGCGLTNQQVIDQFEPQFTQLRADLKDIASTLPSVAEVKNVAQPLDPRPVYVEGSDEIQNTDILMFENLSDPDTDLRTSGQLDLTLSNYLLRYLRWTGPDSPMSASALKARAPKDSAGQFEQALNIRYIGVAAVVKYDPPVAVSESAFTGGYAEILGFLVDRETRQTLCVFRISALSNQDVSYTYQEGDSKTQALEKFAYSTLWTNARTAFLEEMGRACGGDFQISE